MCICDSWRGIVCAYHQQARKAALDAPVLAEPDLIYVSKREHDELTARAERAETEVRAGVKLYVAALDRAKRAEAERDELRAQLEIVRQGFHAATCADYPQCTDLAHETDYGRAVAVADEQRRAACDERDDARNERERAEAAIQRVKAARSRLRSALIAVSRLLDQPYPDAPDQSPWTRFVLPAMRALDMALAEPLDTVREAAALDGTDNTGEPPPSAQLPEERSDKRFAVGDWVLVDIGPVTQQRGEVVQVVPADGGGVWEYDVRVRDGEIIAAQPAHVHRDYTRSVSGLPVDGETT